MRWFSGCKVGTEGFDPSSEWAERSRRTQEGAQWGPLVVLARTLLMLRKDWHDLAQEHSEAHGGRRQQTSRLLAGRHPHPRNNTRLQPPIAECWITPSTLTTPPTLHTPTALTSSSSRRTALLERVRAKKRANALTRGSNAAVKRRLWVKNRNPSWHCTG